MKIAYRMSHQGQKVKVSADHAELARAMDKNGDNYVSNQEIADFYGIENGQEGSRDFLGRVNENKWQLRGLPNPDAKAYHSAEQAGEALLALEQRYPNLCKRVSLGTSHEGRPIWALKVSEGIQGDTSKKTGIVITGCHHAREWMSVEIPLYTAAQLLEGFAKGDPECQRRLKEGEFWFVPVVNPDGLDYSRDVDNMWRKNRTPIDTVVDGKQISTHGVDPNRNHFSPEYPGFYRPDWDKPGVCGDDSERGADDPNSQVFRGLKGASEPEVQAMQKLKFGHANIRGGLDYHSFGESILYPFSYTKEAPENVHIWRNLGEQMSAAAGGGLEVKSSADLYPISGGPLDLEYMHGLVSYEVEVNGCFQPGPEQIAPTCERYHALNMVYADGILAGAAQGTLPERKVTAQ